MPHHDPDLLRQANDAVKDLMRAVITQAHGLMAKDEVTRSLLYFLVRVANTWQSIRTLREHSQDDSIFTNDAAALLRVMFDAYLQAAYIAHDPKQQLDRARLYLEFEHVERYKTMNRIVSLDHPVSEKLRASPLRVEGEARVQKEYDRVKCHYFVKKYQKDGSFVMGPGTRNKWYEPDLASLAKELNMQAEYDLFVTPFHGCIHSSAFVVKLGPVVSAPHVITHASIIAARVAALTVTYNRLDLDPFFAKLLDALCKADSTSLDGAEST